MPQGKKNYRHHQRSDDGSEDSSPPEGFRQLRIHDSRHSRKPVARPATCHLTFAWLMRKKYRLLMSVTTFVCSHMMFLNEQADWRLAVGRRAVFSCCRARGVSFGRGACSWRRSCDGRATTCVPGEAPWREAAEPNARRLCGDIRRSGDFATISRDGSGCAGS